MVPHGSQQSDITLEEEGDANEQLYQKRFEEGYDIYDEEYAMMFRVNGLQRFLHDASYHYSLTT